MLSLIKPFLQPNAGIIEHSDYFEVPIHNPSPALKANAYYYNHPEWTKEYLKYVHRSKKFTSRWRAALNNWDDKVVVDVGCGPGNLLAAVKGKPAIIIGVDVAIESLKIAQEMGYVPILADATHLPLISGFADVVTLNATLHHCDDMPGILKEAARLVKPGGLLVTDHDPQLSAWNYKGIAKLLWYARLVYYRLKGYGFHKTGDQQHWGLESEVHHKPGHGVTKELFMDILKPMGFQVKVFPHNNDLGAEVLEGKKGRAALKYRIGNVLSGRHPDLELSAINMMCVARRTA